MQQEIEEFVGHQPQGEEHCEDLAGLIRENINYQNEQNTKRTLMKESMMKISLDKEFGLFEAVSDQDKENLQASIPRPLLEVTPHVKSICSWLEDTQEHQGAAYLPYNETAQLLHVLHQKIEGTAIIVTEYMHYWAEKMEEIGKLSRIKWGILAPFLEMEEKVKVLELHELKKLRLFFVSPAIFQQEEYYQFECDLLLICDLHLYQNSQPLMDKIITKTNPKRIVGLYPTLLKKPYIEFGAASKEINPPEDTNFNLLALKCAQPEKLRCLLTYLNKNEFKKVLVVVNNKPQAAALNKQLQLEAKTSVNFYDYLSPAEINSFNAPEILTRVDKEEAKMFEVIRKASDISICGASDFLRFGEFDLVVFYSFTDVTKFVEVCQTTKEKLVLIDNDDYYKLRNSITSDLLTMPNLQRIVMKIVEKTTTKKETSKKRFYSDHIDDRIFDCYSTNKQLAEKDDQKVIRINSFCRTHEVVPKTFHKVLNCLESCKVLTQHSKVVYEIEVDDSSLIQFSNEFPSASIVRKKVNLLNLSTKQQKTTRAILDQLRQQGVKFKISEEAIQIKICMNYEDIDWAQLNTQVNQSIYEHAHSLDKSFDIYKANAYTSVELTKRERTLKRKSVFVNFGLEKPSKQNSHVLENCHKSNMLSSEIEEWLRHSQESLDDHELVLLLQGVGKGKLALLKDDPVFGRYRHFKYEDLIEAISRIYKSKRIKLQ